jgi:hypothetical protein
MNNLEILAKMAIKQHKIEETIKEQLKMTEGYGSDDF